jgi:hypothetical protein
MHLFLQKVRAFGLVLFCLDAGTLSSHAQSQVATVPSGYYTINITPGISGSRSLTLLSVPILKIATATGQMAGQVTGITSTTITNSNANWTAGQLSAASTPYIIQFTSGAAMGRSFLISSITTNSTTTVTIDSSDASQTDLTTLGIQPGTDTYKIVPAATLLSFFGAPQTTGIPGGTTSDSADQVQLYTGAAWLSYYYNTSVAGWLRVGPPIPSSNVVLRPETAMIYSRVGTGNLSFMVSGVVPSVNRQAPVANSGLTFLANNWPIGLTLAETNIQNTPGWSKGDQSTADLVQVYNGAWLQYYHNGTNWIHIGPGDDSDTTTIPAGSAVILQKKNSSAGQNPLAQPVPYTL